MSALIQQSDEWLEFRKSKIGASDAPIIMEVSPWKTPYKLWLEKVSTTAPTYKSSSMHRGIELEETARNEFELLTGIHVLPSVKTHSNLEWMIASLDGIDAEQRNIVEIKCPGKADHSIAEQGQIPEKYIPQLQHQLEVCGLDMAYYFSFDGKKGVIVKVYRDDKYIKKMLKKEEEFFECMQNFIAPQACDKDYQTRNDDMFCFSASRLLEIQEAIKGLEKEEKTIKQDLIRICGNQNTRGSGFRFSKSIRKGSVDYSSIDILKDINLETYRKPPIETWRLSSEFGKGS